MDDLKRDFNGTRRTDRRTHCLKADEAFLRADRYRTIRDRLAARADRFDALASLADARAMAHQDAAWMEVR